MAGRKRGIQEMTVMAVVSLTDGCQGGIAAEQHNSTFC